MVIYIYLIYLIYLIFGVTVQFKFSRAGNMQHISLMHNPNMQHISLMHNPKFLMISFFIFE